MKLKLKTKTQTTSEIDVICDGAIIPVKLVRSKRKSLVIQVKPNAITTIRAPMRFPLKSIEKFVCEKKDWIIEKQKELASKQPKTTNNEYIEGEVFQFLGKEYKLKIELNLTDKIEVLDDVILLKTTRPKNKNRNKKLITDWYKNQAEIIFNERLKPCLKIAEKINVEFANKIILRRMKGRWGSCSTDGNITLNIHLIRAAQDCIDYVILHELCHLREHNHSKNFYALMDIVMPNWKATRKKLNESVSL